ncbi:hypothetical protein WY02_13075 [Pseudonocardia sp. AL041005-10]|nr:hypothetical protein WY02_13075 [Pseudonocardia sp. AL041005-10]
MPPASTVTHTPRALREDPHGSSDSGTRASPHPGEVATLFRVDPKTVTRWASAGRIGSIRTPGGHRRFRESEVRGLLADLTSEANTGLR